MGVMLRIPSSARTLVEQSTGGYYNSFTTKNDLFISLNPVQYNVLLCCTLSPPHKSSHLFFDHVAPEVVKHIRSESQNEEFGASDGFKVSWL